jgi:hydrogenase-4 component F
MIATSDSLALWIQLLLPVVLGVFVLVLRYSMARRVLFLFTAAVHLALTVYFWTIPQKAQTALDGWLSLDEMGRLFLGIVSLLFAVSAGYVFGYLARQRLLATLNGVGDLDSVLRGVDRSERIFLASLLFFLSTMTMVTFCQHFELLWVAIEATTLASAPLVYFHRGQHALEATWKYLIICSVGIALALLGCFLLSISAAKISEATGNHSLLLNQLISNGAMIDKTWLKAAFIFIFVGYGTKMGLAPLHTWLPDAQSEAPSAVSSLLSGALLSCAFLGILRAFQVCISAGLAGFAQGLLLFFGLLSIAFAAVFILRQQDFKRMLAYSSVEHMGILSLSVGLGGNAVFAGMLHAIGHSLIKAMLFLLAGNILIAYHTKSTKVVRGVLRVLPISGTLWLLGLFAITGFPPFGLFTSEFLILKSAMDQGRYGIAALFLVLLSIVFIGMLTVSLPMLLGESSEFVKKQDPKEWWWTIIPPAVLAIIILVLGPYIPPFLNSRLQGVSRQLQESDAVVLNLKGADL